jgi:hypothetical protein
VQLKRDIEMDRATLDSMEQELAEAAANVGQKSFGIPAFTPSKQLAPPRYTGNPPEF